MAKPNRQQSDQQRFELLYQRHFDRVAAYLLARSDRDTAAEGLARTFEIAWRRIADVPTEPLPWLLGVARRVLAERLRTQRRQEALIERIGQTVSEAGDDHAEALANRERVLAALGELTTFQQEAVLLIAWDGLSERDAAAALGCSRGALALRLHRARRHLRDTLTANTTATPKLARAASETPACPTIRPSTKETL